MRLPLTIAFLVFGLMLFSAPSHAQELGIRAGASADPDQFYFGGHLETPVADRLNFRPNVEIGLGNDLTLVALNFEFVYRFRRTNGPWSFYAGGGPALNIFNHRSDTDAEGGFNLVGGVQHSEGLFFEMKVGLLDSPDFKVGVGYVFGR